MLWRWKREFAEIEREYREANPARRKEIETIKYQLENNVPFLASFCQNYVPSEVGFERKVFLMKVRCFMIWQLTDIGSTLAQLGEFN